ncbi:hypothetical protein ACRALDRAFT_1092347 [Sodiomyces alcalophilus JCM 7366]|uniref:uncharacterized protein n=1 Tax=Sodiomyces alcalophilus JCM 7366 TaxID=591952 RepID=UPI0039B37A70
MGLANAVKVKLPSGSKAPATPEDVEKRSEIGNDGANPAAESVENNHSSKEEQDTMKEVAHDNVPGLERPHGSASARDAGTVTNFNDSGESRNISRAPSVSSQVSGGRFKKKSRKNKKKNGRPRENQAGDVEKHTGEGPGAAKDIPLGVAAEADQVKPVEDQASSAPGMQPDATVSTAVGVPRTLKETNGSGSLSDSEPAPLTSQHGQRENNRFPKSRKEPSLLQRVSVNNLKNAAVAAGAANPSASEAHGEGEAENSKMQARSLETPAPPRCSIPSECESTAETWYTAKSRQTSEAENTAGLSSPKNNGDASKDAAAAVDNAQAHKPVSSNRAVSMNPRSRTVSVAIPYNLFGRGQAQPRATPSHTITPSSSPIKKDRSPPLDKKPLPAVWPTPTQSDPCSASVTSAQSDTDRQDDGTAQSDTSATEHRGSDTEYVESTKSSPGKRIDEGARGPDRSPQGSEQAPAEGTGTQSSEHTNDRCHQNQRNSRKQRQVADRKRNDKQSQCQSSQPSPPDSSRSRSRSPQKNKTLVDPPSSTGVTRPEKNGASKSCTSQSNSDDDEFPSLPAARKERENPLSNVATAWAAPDRVRTISRRLSTKKSADGTAIPSPPRDAGRTVSSVHTSPTKNGLVEPGSRTGSPVKSVSNSRHDKGEGE